MARFSKPREGKKLDPSRDWHVVEEHEVDAFGVVLIEENGHGERRPVKGTNRDCGELLEQQLESMKQRRRELRAERMRAAEAKVEAWRAKYRAMGREMNNGDITREHGLMSRNARPDWKQLVRGVNALMTKPPRRPKRERVDPMDDGEGEAFVRLDGGDER